MAEITVKAFVLARLMEFAREGLGEQDFVRLEEQVGITLRTLRLAFFKDHPVSLQIKMEEGIARALWNRTDDGAFYEFGKMNFTTFAQSTIGRATLAMTGRDPRRFLEASIRLMGTVMNNMHTETKPLGEHKFSFRFYNNPYRPLGWQGVIDAAMEHVGVDARVRTVLHGANDTEYTIEW